MIFRHLLNMRSHPTWVRGLKHNFLSFFKGCVIVAPYMGAWIETYIQTFQPKYLSVAPYMGAWIET